jgi:hypothetical protein
MTQITTDRLRELSSTLVAVCDRIAGCSNDCPFNENDEKCAALEIKELLFEHTQV